MKPTKPAPLYRRIREIPESARATLTRSVNSTQVVANWLIGREIVEEEQRGHKRAEYGERLIEGLSRRLMEEYGRGFTVRNIETFRSFYLEYPRLIAIPHAPRAESERSASPSHALPGLKCDAGRQISEAPRRKLILCIVRRSPTPIAPGCAAPRARQESFVRVQGTEA